MDYLSGTPQGKLVFAKAHACYEDDLAVGGIGIGLQAQGILRIALGCDLSAEELECVKLERELESARKDGLIVLYEVTSPHVNSREWLIRMTPCRVHHGKTKLEVLQSAAEFVRSLREPKLEDMDAVALVHELKDRGCKISMVILTGDRHTLQVHDPNGPGIGGVGYNMAMNETPEQLYRRALREVRKETK